MSELINIDGIGTDEAELLVATGWTDVHALARADIEILLKEIHAANEMLRIVPRTPERKKVERWISTAGRMIGPGGVKKRGSKPAGDTAAVAAEKPRRASRAKAAAKEPVPASRPEQPASAVPLEDAGEAQLKALSGPVNFEAEPDVMEMLTVAPFALPIPARMLAERGIAPSEIAVAPVLNRALGDIEVRVVVEKPRRKDLPAAPAAGRRSSASGAVQVADLGFSVGRRGFDATKIRTIEEAQGDAPPVRAASTKSGMDDDRIALLRAPRPETNAGRNPGSKFYIRGVLHDRPYLVWFGGVVLILLQLCLPLAVIGAPLLILSDQMPEKFSWVPSWIIAFPLILPVLGILFTFISARAKCRVCAQRMYVPKHCLKNRKAHHLPLFGYIGAVAMHVITFRWYNCTFCGTSIRIKK
jgi:hypothetical protein